MASAGLPVLLGALVLAIAAYAIPLYFLVWREPLSHAASWARACHSSASSAPCVEFLPACVAIVGYALGFLLTFATLHAILRRCARTRADAAAPEARTDGLTRRWLLLAAAPTAALLALAAPAGLALLRSTAAAVAVGSGAWLVLSATAEAAVVSAALQAPAVPSAPAGLRHALLHDSSALVQDSSWRWSSRLAVLVADGALRRGVLCWDIFVATTLWLHTGPAADTGTVELAGVQLRILWLVLLVPYLLLYYAMTLFALCSVGSSNDDVCRAADMLRLGCGWRCAADICRAMASANTSATAHVAGAADVVREVLGLPLRVVTMLLRCAAVGKVADGTALWPTLAHDSTGLVASCAAVGGMLVLLCATHLSSKRRPAVGKPGALQIQVSGEPSLSVLDGEDDAPGPEDDGGFLSRYTFWWCYPTLRQAQAAGRLDASDLPRLPIRDRPSSLLRRFGERWTVGRRQRLMFTLMWRIQPGLFLYSFLHGMLFLSCMFADPLLLRPLLSSSQNGGTSGVPWKKMGYVACLSVSMLVRVTCMEICYFASARLMNNCRTALIHSIFCRALHLPIGDTEWSAGKLTNLMATDADKIGKTAWTVWCCATWVFAVVSLPAVIYFMHELVGTAAFVGLGTVLVGNWLSMMLGRLMIPIVKRLQERRDERSSAMDELVRTARLIKLMVWQVLWERRVTGHREREMRELVYMRLMSAANQLVGSLVGLAIPVSIFAWYTLVQKKTLQPSTAFTTLAWIGQMQWCLNSLPAIYNMWASLSPSCDRLLQLLASGSAEWSNFNIDGSAATLPHGGGSFSAPNNNDGGSACSMDEAVLGYLSSDNAEERVPVLRSLTIDVALGDFVVVCGAVGTGKSTLLAAMAGAALPLSGSVRNCKSRAYVEQKPFLFNGSIRENILFGLDLDQREYDDALHRSALLEDLSALPAGDASLCGEAGIQLSGGQKARVALARALYSRADAYFFDDVLSAVDAHTGKHVWEHALCELHRRGKTVVLATHQLQYLDKPEVARVLIIKDGEIWLDGPWRTIADDAGDEISKFASSSEASSKGDGATKRPSVTSVVATEVADADLSLAQCEAFAGEMLQRFVGQVVSDQLVGEFKALLRQGGASADHETRRAGLISWLDFKTYLAAFGSKLSCTALLLCAAASGTLACVQNVWLAAWTDNSNVGGTKYLSVYVAIGCASAVSLALQTVVLTVCALKASRLLHALMLKRVLHSPLRFFDETPTGRIQNRFLQDMANVDNFVPNAMLDTLTKLLNIFTQLSLVVIFAWWVVGALPVLIPIYCVIYVRVRCAARDTRRIESVAHSPVYSFFADALAGRATIAAFGAEPRFIKKNLGLIEQMATAKYGNEACNKWAQALTTQSGCFLYCVCGFVCAILNSRGLLSASLMGLVLLYASSLQRAMMDMLMTMTNLETQFVSVERVAEYTRLPIEATDTQHLGPVVTKVRPLASSPSIRISDLCFRYRVYRRPVLNRLSMVIPPQSKVAVCGRTGCGKSTLLSAICRLYEPESGTIDIADSDALDLPISDVRRMLRVVTQDAVLLSDTIRVNLVGELEPRTRADAACWHALAQVGLEKMVKALPGGLDFEIEPSGSNFSVGERQLLCLARALAVRDEHTPRILLCDEATANVDLNSDELVHRVILGLDSTVLMICHRLQHIANFDLVFVLANGAVAETGAPKALLADGKSMLSKLMAEASLDRSEHTDG